MKMFARERRENKRQRRGCSFKMMLRKKNGNSPGCGLFEILKRIFPGVEINTEEEKRNYVMESHKKMFLMLVRRNIELE